MKMHRLAKILVDQFWCLYVEKAFLNRMLKPGFIKEKLVIVDHTNNENIWVV